MKVVLISTTFNPDDWLYRSYMQVNRKRLWRRTSAQALAADAEKFLIEWHREAGMFTVYDFRSAWTSPLPIDITDTIPQAFAAIRRTLNEVVS